MNNATTARLDALLNDLARRLRARGEWTNRDGDECRAVLDALRRLETSDRPGPVAPSVRRPLTSWADADAVLRAIIAEPSGVESGWRFVIDAGAVVWLARVFGVWAGAGLTPPRDVRVIRFGDVVVEWSKGSILISGGSVHVTGKIPRPIAPDPIS